MMLYFTFQSLESTRRMMQLCEEVSSNYHSHNANHAKI